MERLMSWLLLGILAAGLVVGLSFLFALPIMLLWNWLMPAIFGLPQITFLQALGLNVLSGLLFRSYPSSSSKD